MKVAFRADASIQIGTGHVMRCLTLAEELRRLGHKCVFICRAHQGHLGDLVARKGFEVHLLAKQLEPEHATETELQPAHFEWLGVNRQTDANETRAILNMLKPEWLVVDHYALDANWEEEMKSAVGKIMVIDDLADRVHDCSVLLDQNLGRRPSDYDKWVPIHCKKLVGPEYALLRPEFIEARPKSLSRRHDGDLKRILISLGGVDRANGTGKVLEALLNSHLPTRTELDIIMGPSAPHLAEVQRQAAELPFRSAVNVGVDNMAERMFLADLSIGSAGSTAWERCALGLPTLLVVLAENQLPGAVALRTVGAACLIETPEAITVKLPRQLIFCSSPSKLYAMSCKAAEVTAGKGVSLVAQVLDETSRELQ